MNKLLSIISFLAAGEEDEIVNQGYKRFIGIVNIVFGVSQGDSRFKAVRKQ